MIGNGRQIGVRQRESCPLLFMFGSGIGMAANILESRLAEMSVKYVYNNSENTQGSVILS